MSGQVDPKNQGQTDSGDNAGAESAEQVDIHEASIEDLDAALEQAQKTEIAGESEASESEVSQAEDPQAEVRPDGSKTTSPDNSNQTDQTPVTTSEDVAGRSAAASKPRQYTPEEVDAIAAENARLKKEGNQKELFIQRRGTELGNLRAELGKTRKELLAAKQALEQGLQDKFQEDPVKGIEDRERIKELDGQIQGLDSQEARASKIVEAQTFFLRHVDTEKVSPQDIANVLKEDGLSEQHLATFLANPWEWTTPEALVQMGKRAEDRKNHEEAINDRMILARHVLHLQGELDKAKKRPGEVARNIQRNLSRAPSVSSASTSVSRGGGEDLDPTQMTVAELDAALKNAMRQ